MIPEERQDQAIAYLFGELSPAQQSAFESEVQRDPELQAFIGELRESLGQLARTAPLATPSAALKDRVMAITRASLEPMPVPMMEIPGPTSRRAPWGWMAFSTVLLLVTLAALLDDWGTRAKFAAEKDRGASVKHDLELVRGDLDSQRQQIASLEQQNSLAQLRVATLGPLTPPLSKANAVVIWNAGQQTGVIKGDHLPVAGAGKDYQLWLIDPSTPGPVSAGVIAVGQDGSFAIAFKPVHAVASVARFAISVEASGGADSPHGPIVFVGG